MMQAGSVAQSKPVLLQIRWFAKLPPTAGMKPHPSAAPQSVAHDFLAQRPASALPGLVFALLATGLPLLAQGGQADYDRALGLAKATENKVFRARVKANWLPDGVSFWYRVETGPAAHDFILVNAERGERKPAFDHLRLAAALSFALGSDVKPERLPLDNIEFRPDESAVLFRAGGKGWRWNLDTHELRGEAREEKALRPRRADRAPRASRRTGEETELVFVNRTQGDVDLYWLDSEGERKGYGRVGAGGERRQHTFAGHVWLVTDRAGTVLGVFEATEEPGRALIEDLPDTPAEAAEKPPVPGQPAGASPDGRWIASLRDSNLVLRDAKSGEEVRFTHDGNADDPYTEPFCWSPDSSHLVVLQTRQAQEHKVQFVESSPRDQLQPKLHTIDYLKPGDRIAHPRPRLFDVVARKQIPISDTLFSNPYELEDVRWAPDSSRFTFRYNQRGHQVLRLIAVDVPRSGAAASPGGGGTGGGVAAPAAAVAAGASPASAVTEASDRPMADRALAPSPLVPRALIEETALTFVDYADKTFLHWLDATAEAIWMSERDGRNHLYLYDTRLGQVRNPITHGEWVVRRVERVDEQKRQIWFFAGGVRPGQDPYYLHLCRVNFDGTGFTVLTDGDGTHAVEFSPDRRYLLDRWSRVDQPPVTELRRTEDGRLLCELERGDASAAIAAGWTMPERFVAKGRDGRTDIYGILVKPSKLDPAKKYPVVEEIYAGPQDAHVPKEFGRLIRQHALAELGFVVVQIDGMGTNWREKEFHDVCWKNLADAGFPDRKLWIRAAATTRPWMDLAHVGIYGGSAGGQNAMRALLDHGDFYRVAVADCGCHDNRMDKLWWNELWLGWPVDESYARNSNTVDAHKMQGKLLLMVGELDTNVDPASTMQVVNALEKASKDFELLVIAGTGHGAAETPYGSRRRMDFLVRNLMGVEPRWEPDAK
jgi:dipeptidyl-peptidase 4